MEDKGGTGGWVRGATVHAGMGSVAASNVPGGSEVDLEEMIQRQEKQTAEYTEFLSTLLRSAQRLVAVTDRSEDTAVFSELQELSKARLLSPDQTVASTLSHFATLARQVEQMRAEMARTLQSRLIQPLSDMVQRGVRESKQVTRNFEKSYAAYSQAEAKVQQTTRSRGAVALAKLEEVERARNEALTNVRNVAVVTMQTLLAINQRSRIQMVRGICDYLRAYQLFFSGGLMEVQNMAPDLEAYAQDLLSKVVKDQSYGSSAPFDAIDLWVESKQQAAGMIPSSLNTPVGSTPPALMSPGGNGVDGTPAGADASSSHGDAGGGLGSSSESHPTTASAPPSMPSNASTASPWTSLTSSSPLVGGSGGGGPSNSMESVLGGVNMNGSLEEGGNSNGTNGLGTAVGFHSHTKDSPLIESNTGTGGGGGGSLGLGLGGGENPSNGGGASSVSTSGLSHTHTGLTIGSTRSHNGEGTILNGTQPSTPMSALRSVQSMIALRQPRASVFLGNEGSGGAPLSPTLSSLLEKQAPSTRVSSRFSLFRGSKGFPASDSAAAVQQFARVLEAGSSQSRDGSTVAFSYDVEDVVRVLAFEKEQVLVEVGGEVGRIPASHLELVDVVGVFSCDVLYGGKKENKVLEVRVAERRLVLYDPLKQTRREYDEPLLMVERAWPQPTLRLHWKGQGSAETLQFRKMEQLAWVYDASWLIRHPGQHVAPKERITIFAGTWNLGKSVPGKDLSTWLVPGHDVYFVSAQECDYAPRPGFSSCAVDWYSTVAAHLGPDYIKLCSISLLSIRVVLFSRREHYYKITNIRSNTVATGIGNVVGNKGAVTVSLHFHDTRLCFVGSHLAAHEPRVEDRNQNYRDIVRNCKMAPMGDVLHYFHHVIWAGDLNYRVELPRERVLDLVAKGQIKTLLMADQLAREQKAGAAFGGFREGDVHFRPTYRYCRGSRVYNEEKMRVPSFTDRVLWRSLPDCELELLGYDAVDDIVTSDHSPVWASFALQPRNPASAYRAAASCHLQFTAVEVSAPALQRGSVLLSFAAEFLEGAVCQDGLAKDGVASWSKDDVPPLRPFVSSRPYVRGQHIFFTVTFTEKGQEKADVGYACVSLAAAEHGKEIAFSVPLSKHGCAVGSVTGGYVAHWLEGGEEGSRAAAAQGGHVKKLRAGYLMKKGAKVKNWKRRWFILSGWDLRYYEYQDASKLLGVINLEPGCEVAEGTEKLHCFTIRTPARTYVCAADNDEDMHAWIRSMRLLLNSFRPFQASQAAAGPDQTEPAEEPRALMPLVPPVRNDLNADSSLLGGNLHVGET